MHGDRWDARTGRERVRGRRAVGHRRRSYRRAGRLASLLAAWLLALVVAPVVGGDSAIPLRADGSWRSFTISTPGRRVAYAFETVAGARYRVTAQPGTLARPVFELGPGRDTLVRVDAGSSGVEAIHDFYAERDGSLSVRVGGFSASTGTARLRLEAIDPEGRRTDPHRRILAEGGTLARVGELWIGEENVWDLVVRPGRSYEVRSTAGTASRIVLTARSRDGAVLATSESDPRPFPAVRFDVPAAPPAAPPAPPVPPRDGRPTPAPPARAPYVLDVRGLEGAGGTYGVRLLEVAAGDPGAAGRPPADAQPVETGPLPDVPLGFRVNVGDVAMLFVPAADPYDPHLLEVREETGWVPVPREALSVYGERANARTPERAAAVAFRAHRAGDYRFQPSLAPDAPSPVLRVHPAGSAGGAPLLLGSNLDPTVLARATSKPKTIGLGFCLPGFDYLFVAAGGGVRDLSMRVVGMDGSVIAQRPSGAFASLVAGVGPSMRFRLREPQIVRLEVAGSAWRGHALLRRASN